MSRGPRGLVRGDSSLGLSGAAAGQRERWGKGRPQHWVYWFPGPQPQCVLGSEHGALGRAGVGQAQPRCPVADSASALGLWQVALMDSQRQLPRLEQGPLSSGAKHTAWLVRSFIPPIFLSKTWLRPVLHSHHTLRPGVPQPVRAQGPGSLYPRHLLGRTEVGPFLPKTL